MKYLNELWEHIEAVHFSDQDSTELERLFRLTDERIVFDTGKAKGELVVFEDFKLMMVRMMRMAFDTAVTERSHAPTTVEQERIRQSVVRVFNEALGMSLKAFEQNTLEARAAKLH